MKLHLNIVLVACILGSTTFMAFGIPTPPPQKDALPASSTGDDRISKRAYHDEESGLARRAASSRGSPDPQRKLSNGLEPSENSGSERSSPAPASRWIIGDKPRFASPEALPSPVASLPPDSDESESESEHPEFYGILKSRRNSKRSKAGNANIGRELTDSDASEDEMTSSYREWRSHSSYNRSIGAHGGSSEGSRGFGPVEPVTIHGRPMRALPRRQDALGKPLLRPLLLRRPGIVPTIDNNWGSSTPKYMLAGMKRRASSQAIEAAPSAKKMRVSTGSPEPYMDVQ